MSHLQMKLLRKKIEKRNVKLRQRNLKLQGFFCVFLAGCPGTCYVDHTGLECTELHLCLPSKCWD